MDSRRSIASRGCASSLELAQWAVGDLEHAAAAAVSRHTAACSGCRRALEELRGNLADFEARGERPRRRLQARLSRPRAGRWRRLLSVARRGWLAGALTGVAVAAVAVLAVSLLGDTGANGDRRARRGGRTHAPVVTYKGSLALRVVAKRDHRQWIVSEGETLRPGDSLRFTLTTTTAGFLTIFSVDRGGRIFPYYPAADPRRIPAPLSIARGRTVLPGSIVLDEALIAERIIVAFSPRPFSRREVHGRAQARLARDPAAALDARALRIAGAVRALTIRKALADRPAAPRVRSP